MALSKEKKERVVLVLNTALFLLAGIDYFNLGNSTLFVVLMVAAISNFSMIFFPQAYKARFNIFLFFMNSMIAFLVARDYFFSGSFYIHFAWIFAGIVYLVAALVFFKRSRK